MLRAALFMALVAGTPANAAMVSYEYVFHPANPEVSVIYHGPFGVDGPMIASQYSSPGYWSDPDLTFGFRYHGDLAGKTFDLKTLLEAPPVGFEDVYFYSEALTYPFPGYLTPQGFVTLVEQMKSLLGTFRPMAGGRSSALQSRSRSILGCTLGRA